MLSVLLSRLLLYRLRIVVNFPGRSVLFLVSGVKVNLGLNHGSEILDAFSSADSNDGELSIA